MLLTGRYDGAINVSIAVGQAVPGELPTVIGSPCLFIILRHLTTTQSLPRHTTAIIIHRLTYIFTSRMTLHTNYTNTIPLELRPLGATSVQYVHGLMKSGS